MSKIKREYSYRTTDNKVFVGKYAKDDATRHQSEVDFDDKVAGTMFAAYSIFNVNTRTDNKEKVIKMAKDIKRTFRYNKCESFEDIVRGLVRLHSDMPEVTKFFNHISNAF